MIIAEYDILLLFLLLLIMLILLCYDNKQIMIVLEFLMTIAMITLAMTLMLTQVVIVVILK